MKKADPWISLFSGTRCYFLRRDPQQYKLIDIAHHLSLLNRFTGATCGPYSVAQHSVAVASTLKYLGMSDLIVKTGLLHDASEMVLNDVATPVKNQLPDYQEMENLVMETIAEAFGFSWPMPAIVKCVDKLVTAKEKEVWLSSRLEQAYWREFRRTAIGECGKGEGFNILTRFEEIDPVINELISPAEWDDVRDCFLLVAATLQLT